MARAPTDIRSLARSHAKIAIQTLAGIAGERNCPPAARVAASIALLDRGFGKPAQTNINAAAGEEQSKQILAWLDEHEPGEVADEAA